MLVADAKAVERTPQGADKVTRYKWQMLDEPPMYLEIDKLDLTIDNEYQRHGEKTTAHKVQEMASCWSWLACGALVVAHRDGVFFVVDGWHRVLAARRRSDIKNLPCLVFESTSQCDEAMAFRVSNTFRKPMGSVYRYRAMLVEGRPEAIWISRLLEMANRTASEHASGKTMSCITALLKLYPTQRAVVDRIWPLVVSLTEGKVLHNVLLAGLVYLESKLDNDVTLVNKDLSKRVLAIGAERLLTGAYRSAEYKAKGTPKTWAEGMLNVLNHGCRNRLTMRGSDAE